MKRGKQGREGRTRKRGKEEGIEKEVWVCGGKVLRGEMSARRKINKHEKRHSKKEEAVSIRKRKKNM